MAGNVYQQYVWLLDLISRRDGITFKDISETWQRSCLNETGQRLPRRTFINHLKKIEEMFGIEIKCTTGFKYRIVNSGDIDLDNAQQSLLAHLQLSNALFANPKLAKRISLDGYLSFRYFSPLIEAMENGRTVELHCSGHKKKVNDMHIGLKIEPYYIKQFENNWFVVGRDVKSSLMCAYAFESISAICESENGEKFEITEDFDVAEFMRNPQFGDSIYNNNSYYLKCLAKANRAPRRSRWTQPYIPEDYNQD